MKFLSICSGIEAASAAWKPLGWEAVGFSEIEPFPSAVLKHHYPEVPNHGDMTKFMEWPDATIDVLCGGTPCQSFSVAGLRKGLDDPRGNLMLTFLAIAKRYRPTWVVWENVPGVLSSNGGRDFGSFLGGLAECGYGFAYRVLDAQYFGLAQRRKRVFVVGHLGDWHRAAAVLFEQYSLQGNPAPSRETRKRLAPSVTSGPPFSRTGNDRVEADAMVCADIGFSVTGSVTSGYGPKLGTDEACQGSVVPCMVPDTSMCLNAGGMKRQDSENETLLPVAFAQNQRDEVRVMDVAGALAAEPGAKQQTYLAQPVAFSIMPMNSGKDYKAREVDVAQPLMAGGPVGGNQGGDFVAQPVTYDFFNITAPVNRQSRTPGDPCHTLARSNAEHAVVMEPVASHPTQDPISSTKVCHAIGANENATAAVAFRDTADCLTSAYGTKWNGNASADNGSLFAAQAMQVRRLTPVECERLQGFPDGYTAIPWRNKPASECPDGPRYKALGNSWAVPVVRWIGERIVAVNEIKPTKA